MQLHSVRAHGLRNLFSDEISLFSGVNLFLGPNGQGKTNFLEMIGLLAFLKSFRNAKRDDIISWGENELQIEAQMASKGLEKHISLSWNGKNRVLKINGNRLKDLHPYLNEIKAVCFSPEDIGILHGSPNQRRRFIDRLVFQCYPPHLFLVKDYNRVLKHRNACLKIWQKKGGSPPQELEIWTEKMHSLASKVTQNRLQFIQDLNVILPKLYSKVSGKIKEDGVLDGDVQIFRLKKGKKEDSKPSIHFEFFASEYQKQISKTQGEERFRGISLWGPHLEDFNLYYGKLLAHRFASTGQKKTLLLALRLSELEMVAKRFQEAPLLLLDDLSAELDSKRLKTFIGFLAEELSLFEEKPQTFLTTVSPDFELYLPLGEIQTFQVHQGHLRKIGS